MRRRGSRVITSAPSTPSTGTKEIWQTSPEFEKFKSVLAEIVRSTQTAL